MYAVIIAGRPNPFVFRHESSLSRFLTMINRGFRVMRLNMYDGLRYSSDHKE